ncbi:TetR/AcrR family transcriptional regulator [Nocardioides sp.]|uniref:TetR/AcrR family transcriptional regulator n=1 Tax=Nocardioides sp. TaxID=35761 RepID=UPI00260685B4|nr:TetR/AcrR family transcriptional regulator [Nocardioides sp.]
MTTTDKSAPRASKSKSAAAGSARRAQLLQIAAEMFADRGYAQTTVRDIADAGGILSGSLYHHFPSKEAMLTELLASFLGGLEERFGTVVAESAGPREALDGLVVESFRTIHVDRHAVALYQSEQDYLAGVAGFEFVGEGGQRNENTWLGVLEAGRASGEFREDLEVKMTYRFIRDAVWGTVRWYRPGGKTTWETLAERYLDLLHGGLLRR